MDKYVLTLSHGFLDVNDICVADTYFLWCYANDIFTFCPMAFPIIWRKKLEFGDRVLIRNHQKTEGNISFEIVGIPWCFKSLDSSLTQPQVIPTSWLLRGLCKVVCWSRSSRRGQLSMTGWPHCLTGKCRMMSCVRFPFIFLFWIWVQVLHGGWGKSLEEERTFYNMKLLLAIACFCPREPEKQA